MSKRAHADPLDAEARALLNERRASAQAEGRAWDALTVASNHLWHLLHETPGFPDAERHETAVVMTIVTKERDMLKRRFLRLIRRHGAL